MKITVKGERMGEFWQKSGLKGMGSGNFGNKMGKTVPLMKIKKILPKGATQRGHGVFFLAKNN